MSKKFKKVLAVLLLLVLAAAALLIWQHFSPGAQAGSKEISFTVVHGDGSEKQFTIRTDSENLRGALEPEGLISGEEGPYGLFVTVVDGETADDSQHQWWCFTKGGEDLFTGVDDTMIADGESYEATLSYY